MNIARAREQGITAATITHPWNEDLVNSDGVIGGKNWTELRSNLEPFLPPTA